jgi:mycoredoxin
MSHSKLMVYGAPWCGDCKRAKKFLGALLAHYDWVDIEQDADGLALVERVNAGWLPAEVERDGAGFIVTGPALETSVPGVFAAGEGATAALMIREYLKGV